MRTPPETAGRGTSAADEAEYIAWLKKQEATSALSDPSAGDDDDGDVDDDEETREDAADRPGLRIGDQMHLGLAREKMHAPVMEWIHRPSEGKAALFAAHESLRPRERAEWDADVHHAFREAHGGHDSAVMYRMKDNPSHMGGMSLTTEKPTHLRPDQYHAFEVRPADVLAHWNQNESPLGGKAFGHEREVILRPQAEPRALGDGSWDESKHPRGPDGRFDAGDWDEGKHPRDERGRFGEGGGGPGAGHGATARAGQNFGRTLRRGHNEPRIEPPVNPMRPALGPPQTHLDEQHFQNVTIDPHAALGFHEVVGQFEHPELAAWLERQPASDRPALVLSPETAGTADGGRTNGLYFSPRIVSHDAQDRPVWSTPTIQVAVGADKPNLPAADYRDWGDVWGVAEWHENIKNKEGFASGRYATKSPAQFAHDVFLHELGHHMEMGNAAAVYNRSPGEHPHIRDIIDQTYAKHFDEMHRVTVAGESHPMGIKYAVLQGHEVKNPAVSRYAATNSHEYFAESFSAYVIQPAALEKHDPSGYAMVKDVLTRLGVEGAKHDAGEWDESLHPRDERGRFGEGAGAAAKGRSAPFGRISKEPAHAPSGPSPAFRAAVEAARERAAERGRIIEPAPPPAEDKPWRGEPGWTPGPDELSSESFAVFNGSLHAPITPDDAVSGFRHEGVATWLKNEENRPALVVHPLHAQGGTVRRGTYENDNAWPMGAIEISSDPSAMPEAGKGLPYGKTWTVSARAAYDGELPGTQASFAHEMGHHIHLAGRTELVRPTAHSQELHEQHLAIDRIVDAAYRRTGIGETVSGIAVQRGEAPSPAVSRYAMTNPHEYFAESFAGYIVDRAGLRAHDPNGYRMVRDVLQARGITP